MSLEFLSPSAGVPARSPMERQALAAGAELERRAGWSIAVRYGEGQSERERRRSSVGFADLSHLGKVELQGDPADVELGRATWADGAWWCAYTHKRTLALCEPSELPGLRDRLEDAAAGRGGLTSVIDVTTAFAAIAVVGPLAGELFARFTALDLRDRATPIGAFRPGSVARTPGAILRESEDRWLMLFGAALGQYVWTVVADAAESLGGGPVGVGALERVGEEVQPLA